MDGQAELAAGRSVEAAQRSVEGDCPRGHKFLLWSPAVREYVMRGLS